MPDEVTFIDLATITRMTPDTTLEKLGSLINASIFDASNLAGSLKQKGLIDFVAYYPGPNTIKVTDQGRALIADADSKAAEPFDSLDHEILKQLSGGKRSPLDLQKSLNVRPKDLALRLYKLSKQGFTSYELRSGGSDVSLTEAGFLKAKTPQLAPDVPQYRDEPAKYVPPPPPSQVQLQRPPQPPRGAAQAQQPAAPAPPQQTQQPAQQAAAPQVDHAAAGPPPLQPSGKGLGVVKALVAVVAIVAVVLIALHLLKAI